ncbi:MAG: LysR family transcriptional regulator [Ketobacter sp.]|nr:LysR family transcriptional regulator [Ketobacter sp.]HAU13483.1 LysR family transcriptional regulator [Gammaproteobacteria bacterium]|tara:strand:- start:100 stop:1020 length:921 start_codon:yes stop_codon:yes gene_type:complete
MLEEIRNFVAVVQAGSFTRAAEELNSARSVISKRLSQLERQLGVRLLNRTTRRLSLTEAGERFYQECSVSLSGIDAAVDEVRSLNQEPRGRLFVNLPMSFGILHVAPLIPAFMAQFPLVQVELNFDDRKVDVIDPGFDVSIRIGELEDSSLAARRLGTCCHQVVAAPAYLKQYGVPQSPQDLVHHRVASFRFQESALEWTFEDNEGQPQSVKLTAAVVSNNSLAIKEIVLGGGAIARVPSFLLGRELEKGSLINLFPQLTSVSRDIYAVFPRREYMPAKTRAFIEFLAQALAAPPWQVGSSTTLPR